MSTPFSLQRVLSRSLGLVVVAGTAWAAAGAQTGAQTGNQSAGTAGTSSAAVLPAAATSVYFNAPVVSPMLGSTSSAVPAAVPGGDALFSSSNSIPSEAEDAGASATQLNLASVEKGIDLPGLNAQYGRRRYGAPRYRGGNTNADGSEKYSAYAGVGLTLPIGTNSNYLTTSYGIQVGGGRNFNKHFGVNLEFDYDHFGLTGAAIDQQSYIYFGDSTNPYGLDANSHIWNLSVQPVYQIYSGEGLGAYLTGGVGFYHKVANFTLPQEESDIFGDEFFVNQTVDHYTSNAPGFDGGIGLTYKFSHFSNERLYGEVRYVYVDNSFRPGVTPATAPTYTGNNLFPQNSNTTSYIPIKFGIRF